MSSDANDPLQASTQQFTGLAMRANRVLMETAESALGLQLGQLQHSASATGQYQAFPISRSCPMHVITSCASTGLPSTVNPAV